MVSLEKLVTWYFGRKRKKYDLNDEMYIREGAEPKFKEILNSPDWLLKNYDDTEMDVPALQTVLNIGINFKTLPWYIGTGVAFLKKGLGKLFSEIIKRPGILSKPREWYNTFKNGGKEAQSKRWEKFCWDYLVSDVNRYSSFNYTQLAENHSWDEDSVSKMLYPGVKEFMGLLKERNSAIGIGVITRDIRTVVEASYRVLGISDNVQGAYYLVGDKKVIVDNFDLQEGQKVVYIWDSIEDVSAIDRAREKVGAGNVLSIQIVGNEQEINKEHADIALHKNYNPLCERMKENH